jgi:hypothetical protein
MPARKAPLTRHNASELPRIMTCSGSKALCREVVQVDVENAAGSLGTAFHEYQRSQLHGDDLTIPDLEQRYGIEAGELQTLVNGFPFEIREGEAEEKGSIKVGKHTVTMRIDLREQIADDVWRVWDYKTTQLTEQEAAAKDHWQLLVMGLETLESKEGCKYVDVGACLVRLGRNAWQDTFRIDERNVGYVRAELEAGLDRTVREGRKPADQRRYTVSTHCDWCPARLDCPALRKLQQRPMELARQATDLGEALDLEITTENVVQWYTARKTAKAILEEVEKGVKSFVEAMGPQPAGDGKVLDVREVKGKQKAITTGMVKTAVFEEVAAFEATGEEILPGTLKLLTALIDRATKRLDQRERGNPSTRIGIFKE